MEIKVSVSPSHYQEAVDAIRGGDVSVSDDSRFVLIEREPGFVVGRLREEVRRIPVSGVLYFESSEHDVYATLSGGEQYLVGQTLRELEDALSGSGFVRVSLSYIVNLGQVVSIVPTLGLRYRLRMSNGDAITVSRHYSSAFKERVGF